MMMLAGAVSATGAAVRKASRGATKCILVGMEDLGDGRLKT
jgi:hypothetical protein